MLNKKRIFFWLGLFLSNIFLFFPAVIQAGWSLEVPIPFLGKRDVTLGKYVEGIYYFTGMAVGIVGVLMFLVGGFQYMISAGNRGMAGEARKTMINAIVGIVLVLAAYVVLRQINTQLVDFEKQLEFPNK